MGNEQALLLWTNPELQFLNRKSIFCNYSGSQSPLQNQYNSVGSYTTAAQAPSAQTKTTSNMQVYSNPYYIALTPYNNQYNSVGFYTTATQPSSAQTQKTSNTQVYNNPYYSALTPCNNQYNYSNLSYIYNLLY